VEADVAATLTAGSAAALRSPTISTIDRANDTASPDQTMVLSLTALNVARQRLGHLSMATHDVALAVAPKTSDHAKREGDRPSTRSIVRGETGRHALLLDLTVPQAGAWSRSAPTAPFRSLRPPITCRVSDPA
jgi:hypothetical protein